MAASALVLIFKFIKNNRAKSGKLQSNFIEIKLRHGCSPVNLLYILRTRFTKNISERLLLLVQSGTVLIYYKLGKVLLQSAAASLYYKAGQVVLQSRTGIIKLGDYYKFGQYNLPGIRQFIPNNF